MKEIKINTRTKIGLAITIFGFVVQRIGNAVEKLEVEEAAKAETKEAE